MRIEIDLEDLEELFPPRRSLIGLQFSNDEDFERAQALTRGDFDLYKEVYPVWKMIVVRREDATRFAKSGLNWQEIEQIDPDELPPEEQRRIERATIDSWKKVLFARARQAE